MEESKALSPEVKGLFETVRVQAKEYAKAFEYLEAQINELNHLKIHLEKFAEQIRNDFNSANVELNKTVVDFVNEVELKTSRVQKVYESLDSIKTLRDELYEASNIMKRQIIDGRNSVQNFKEKSELEISNALSNISNTIEKEIEMHSQRFELNINLKLRQFQSKLLNYDQKMWSLSDSQSRDYKNFVNEVLNTNHKISELNKEYFDFKKTLNDRLKNLEADINSSSFSKGFDFLTFDDEKQKAAEDKAQSIAESQKEISLLEDKKTEAAKNEQFASDLKTFQTEKIINSFPEEKYQDIIRQINELQKLNKSNEMDAASLTSKFKISLAIAIISILIAILSIAIN